LSTEGAPKTPLWSRIRGFFERLTRRTPPQPGRFVAGSAFALKGWLAGSPWVWPSREYLVYVPAGYSRWRRRPLVVLLHGCRQTPEDFATATRIAALADKKGWLVLLPRQASKANPWICWNWFDRGTVAGWGEAAIVAAQVRAVRREYRAHPRQVFVAGMSAGAALAAVAGLRQRRFFAGVIAHSGLACGAASGPAAAMGAMARGADTAYERLAEQARVHAPPGTLPVALLAIHGGEDRTVADTNSIQLVRQYLVLNGRLEAQDHPPGELPPPDASSTQTLGDGRSMTVAEYRDGERVIARYVRVPALGHAWSGGDASFPYNDPLPPDATALLGDFVDTVLR
jgi:poly(hydroxyalkanoate) depolymerase family esterase